MRAAILDLNNQVANKGIGYIKNLLEIYGIPYEVFDVRHECRIPDTGFDLYVSSGGPGSPFDMDGVWDKKYFALVNALWAYNRSEADVSKRKYVFFICHSFQLACIHFGIGKISQRGTKSFGTFPTYKTDAGRLVPFFAALPDPFWIADFRDWQVTDADAEELSKRGIEIAAIECPRKDARNPRAVMAVRLSREMFATQFHPEADAEGMLDYFQQREKRNQLIEEQGMENYLAMINDLEDPLKIELTHKTVLPAFIEDALKNIGKHEVVR